MIYYQLSTPLTSVDAEEEAEIIIAEISDLGFESFQQEADILMSYISETEYQLHYNELKEYIATHNGVELEKMPDTNWNAVWESNFEPIHVDSRCTVRAPFHNADGAKYDIVIMPKMSFGTGHHATTHLMIEALLDNDVEGQKGLDMGCGTGILAILAIKRGATHMDAIDIDEWAAENTRENCQTAGIEEQIAVYQGNKSLLDGKHYNFILANINRNILLSDMECYASTLEDGGLLFLSGFLEPDVTSIVEKAESLGLMHIETRSKDGWQRVTVQKK